MTAYGEQRYADALEAVRGGLEHSRTTPACITTTRASQRSRATPATKFAHLQRSVELRQQFREDARRDDDFAAVRDDPRFEQALP